MISETREKKAHPILLTPVSRRIFNQDGMVIETHPEYSPLAREVAIERLIAQLVLKEIKNMNLELADHK